VSKLAPKWLGPFKVIEKISDVYFVLKKLDGSKMGAQHISTLKKYFMRSNVDLENSNSDENSARQKDNDFCTRSIKCTEIKNCKKGGICNLRNQTGLRLSLSQIGVSV
jgi:hypothetical protein